MPSGSETRCPRSKNKENSEDTVSVHRLFQGSHQVVAPLVSATTGRSGHEKGAKAAAALARFFGEHDFVFTETLAKDNTLLIYVSL